MTNLDETGAGAAMARRILGKAASAAPAGETRAEIHARRTVEASALLSRVHGQTRAASSAGRVLSVRACTADEIKAMNASGMCRRAMGHVI